MTQGFDEPMSVLGLEIWADMLEEVKAGTFSCNIGGTAPTLHGRQYMSFTDFQKLMGRKSVNKFLYTYDGNIKKNIRRH